MIYDLPFGHGRHFDLGGNKPLDYVVGGWSVNMINTMTSGLPLNIGYSPTSQAQISSLVSERPNLTGQPLYLNSSNPINYLNAAAFSVPVYTQPFGNTPRNNARMPAFYETDFGLHKNFSIAESRYVQFRAEAFNLLNHTNFAPTLGLNSNSGGLRRLQRHVPRAASPASHETGVLMLTLHRRKFLSVAGAAAALPASAQLSTANFRFAVIADSHIIDPLYKGPESNAEDTESMFRTSERLTSARDFLNGLSPQPELVFLVGDYFHNYPSPDVDFYFQNHTRSGRRQGDHGRFQDAGPRRLRQPRLRRSPSLPRSVARAIPPQVQRETLLLGGAQRLEIHPPE